MTKLTDAVLEELLEKGFAIVPDFVTGEKLKQMQEAQLRVMPSWEEIKDDPPWKDVTGVRPQDQKRSCLIKGFPLEEMVFYQAAIDSETAAFAKKFLKSDNINAGLGGSIARYPGHAWGGTGIDESGVHIDNGNNSLLPQSKDHPEFGQLSFWIHLFDV
ncbi:MAG: hypothetical protein HRT89_08680, partial [Lentisphaeria bacterium]|nr:hypothetical protein [Lentisphaeria bacterium]NQZ68132.1 hypothetical protein [Lentisphaeria bacterium]